MQVARFPLSLVKMAATAVTRGDIDVYGRGPKGRRSLPAVRCDLTPPVNVHCGSEPLTGWVGFSAHSRYTYSSGAYLTDKGFAWPA